MENARDNISLDEPVMAGEKGAVDAPTASTTPQVASGQVPASEVQEKGDPTPDQQRSDLYASFNNRISYLCTLIALVVALVALATMALGKELPQFVLMGLCLSVALLAIAVLQDHHQRKR